MKTETTEEGNNSNGPGVESNPVRKSSRNRKKVERFVATLNASRSTPIHNRTRARLKKISKKNIPQSGLLGGHLGNQNPIKIVKAPKDGVKAVVKKLGSWTGTEKKYILDAIKYLPDKSFHSINITATMKNNFFRVNKEILFGLKKKGIGLVRKMIERDDAGAKQGPSLYGCGTKKKLQRDNSWIWCVNSDSVGQRGGAVAAAALPNDFLVRCWGTKVPCGFKLGAEPYEYAGDGLNHEMEHGIACVKQAFGNLLAQQLGLKDDDKNRFRKYHGILLQIFKDHDIGEEENRKIMVYYIMLMLRRQQIVNGLPSMSLFNQVKCDADLLFFDFKDRGDEFFSFTMEYSKDIIKAVVKLMNGKSGTLGPCTMIGIKNKDSVYNEKNKISKLETYYKHSYDVYKDQADFKDMIERAVGEASTWAKMRPKDKETILTGQCELISNTYNSMFRGGRELLSGICLASSILVMTVVMKSTYVELETENPIVPELNIWADKALEFLKSGNCEKIMEHRDHIEKQVNEMRKSCKHNQASKDYLEMRDITISDLVSDKAVGDLVDKIRAISLDGGADSDADADAETQHFEDESTPEPRIRTPEIREAGETETGTSTGTSQAANLDTPEVVKPPNKLTYQGLGTVVGDPSGEVLITDGSKMAESETPKAREAIEEIEYMEPDYYTSFSEYTEMRDHNAEKLTKFLDLISLRMDESDLLQMLNLFEGYCPDEDDLEITGDEDKCMEILEDEVEELNESFLCYLSCMGDDYDMIIPERMYGEIKNHEGSESGRIKKTKKKRNIKKTSKVKTKRKYNRKKRKTTKKKKRKTTRKKKKQSDLIDKIIDRLGY